MVRWADPAGVRRAVRQHADALRRRHPEVVKVLWYGSWVNGIPTPGSDVDLCVVVSDAARPPRERVPDFLPERFPTGIDLIVVTEEELGDLASRAPSWHRAILEGRDV